MRLQLEQERAELECEIKRHGDGGRARAIAHDINQRIIEDDGGLPHFAQASQNIAFTAALLQRLLEPTTPEDHWAHHEIYKLLERAMVQQVESLLSRRRELDTSQRVSSGRHGWDVFIHQAPHDGGGLAMVPVHERLGPNCDARNTLDAHGRGWGDKREEAGRGYHPHHGRRYDSGED